METLRNNFASATSIWKNQLSQIKAKFPNDRFDIDAEITSLLQRANVKAYNINGI